MRVALLSPRAPAVVARAAAVEAALSEAERSQAERLRRAADREAYLLAHALLRGALADRLRTDPRALRFARRPCPRCGRRSGRPFLPEYPGLEFSLTHTAGLVGLALADVPVGLDVESLDRPPVSALVDALHPRERRELADLDPAARPEAVLRCWVRKEALLKADGAGIAHGVAEPDVGAGPRPHQPPGWTLTDVVAPVGFLAAVAVAASARSTPPEVPTPRSQAVPKSCWL